MSCDKIAASISPGRPLQQSFERTAYVAYTVHMVLLSCLVTFSQWLRENEHFLVKFLLVTEGNDCSERHLISQLVSHFYWCTVRDYV